MMDEIFAIGRMTGRTAPASKFMVLGQFVTTDLLVAVAETRSRMHAADGSHRPLSENWDLIGLLGQREFSIRSGLPMDLGIRHEGDARINFWWGERSIGVSTYRKPGHLLVEADKEGPFIHVLAEVNDNLTGARLICWEYDRIMRLCPVKAMPGQTIMNHGMRAADARPIEDLLAMIQEGGV